MKFGRVFLVVPGLLVAALGDQSPWEEYSRVECQAPTTDPLEGCPSETVLVGSDSKYATIKSAISSLPHDTSSQTLLILPGTYEEQVNVTRAGPVTLLGQTNAHNDLGSNTVEVLWRAVAGTGDNAFTAVLTVAPDLNASLTGAGPTGFAVAEEQPFGNTNFRAYNLNFTNDFLPYSAGPSLTLSTGYANSGFYHCSFSSYQDTIHVGKNASTYISHSSIGGQTDFLYGFGTLWITNSTLLLRGCGGGVTAWKGTNTTFENEYGVYIVDGSVVKANDSLSINHECALGRPWNSQHRSVFARNYLDESILPAGYVEWSSSEPRVTNLTFMGEYEDFGPGFNLTGRMNEGDGVTIELDSELWAQYDSPLKVFHFPNGSFGNTDWIDWSV
ncbi:hypothetical protein OHC33_003542 [Knufia fluminis]|uniref:pectinesterase n=1 Tax=Knufia fluminis TaxID=191047 RepID=A0AAN8EG59_9EURO|nr:hypothetical protein OHC33_003542 [Knufia fluminis]